MSLIKISRIAILAALAVVLRLTFGAFPNIKPITAIFLICAVFYGFWESFLIMSLTMLITSFFMGFGVWVFWQILAYALILLLWTFLFHPMTKAIKFAKLNIVAIQALIAGLLAIIYGLAIDSYSALLYGAPIWPMLLSGIYFNLAHAWSTTLFYPLILSLFRRFIPYEKII